MANTIPADLPDFLKPGAMTPIGSYTFTADRIMDFARQFDPQRFHLDEVEAKNSVLGGLCASGWHTVSAWMKLQRISIAEKTAGLKSQGRPWPEFGPSPGMQDLKWPRPVFAEETIFYTNNITDFRQSRSRPEWWLMANLVKATNEKDECVLTFRSTVFLKIHGLQT